MEKKCEFPNCEKEASYKLTYTEKGARKKRETSMYKSSEFGKDPRSYKH